MGIQVINSANYADHLTVQHPDGTVDEVTVHPGRQNLPEGWKVIEDFVVRKHIRVVDQEKEAVARVAQAGTSGTIIPSVKR